MTKRKLFETVLALESPNNVTYSQQLALIKNPDKKRIVANMLRQADSRNTEEAASSTGKYHPIFAQGKKGLSRHTKAVVSFIADFCEAMPELDYDTMVIAALLHDIMKYKNNEKFTSKTHAEDAAKWLEQNGLKEEARLVKSHMGKFDQKNVPQKFDEKMLHLADYIASRTYISVDFDENDNIIISNDDPGRTANKLKQTQDELEATKYEKDYLLGKNSGF